MNKLLEEWCRIHVLLMREARWILEQFEEREAEPLEPDDFETMVRIVSKMIFEMTGGGLVSELGTPALAETINALFEKGDLVTGKRLLSLFLLEDADDPNWPTRWKEVIEDREVKAFDIDVLIDRLWTSVNRKALDEEQDRRVLKVLDSVEKKFEWDAARKSNVLESIRDLTNVKRASEDR